ncbi:hypothetical protein SERLA73DRAFT_133452, partial [Serpula lacrymans var. lacrymans S7.3]
MGTAASSFAKFADNDKQRRANDVINSLVALANERKESFREKIRSEEDSKSVPINKIIHEYQFMQLGVTNDPQAISTAISGALSGFISGEILPGITKIAGSALDILFGNYSANQSSTSTYTISTGSLGGV